jgi:hypothetical protein
MAVPLLIGAGAGLVSAALFASAATATPLAGLLFYLAPLPLALAGLGWGWMAAALAALIGTIVASATLGLATGLIFAIAIGAPLAVLCYLTLLSRQVALPEGATQKVALEWYPVGRIVGWAAIMAGALGGLMVLILGYDTESYSQSIRTVLEHSALKDLDQDGSLINDSTIGNLSAVLARALPAAFAIVWQSIALFNMWLAGVIVEASGRALRPWPKLDALELPNSIFLAFTASLIASFLPGIAGLIATAFAGSFLFAYVLQGLAVLHVFTRGMPFRAVLLAAIYLGMLLLGWVAVAVAILGLSEPMLRLRERAAARGQPPSND